MDSNLFTTENKFKRDFQLDVKSKINHIAFENLFPSSDLLILCRDYIEWVIYESWRNFLLVFRAFYGGNFFRQLSLGVNFNEYFDANEIKVAQKQSFLFNGGFRGFFLYGKEGINFSLLIFFMT